jgi:type IV pilus assembly protein PilX
MRNKNFPRAAAAAQQGAVLVIGLIMLLLMTIVGLASIRGSNMQELMAGNMKDRQVSFQTAEAGLRAGEIVAGAVSGSPTAANGLKDLLPDGGKVDYWQATYDWAANSTQLSLNLELQYEKPRYVIEQMDVIPVPGIDASGVDIISVESTPPVEFYRVTSRGAGMTVDTFTMLQSIYRRF